MSKANIDYVKAYINDKYMLRNNVISNQIEYFKKFETEKNKTYDKDLKRFEFKPVENLERWEILNEDNILIDLLSNHYKISVSLLISLLKSNFVPMYNPFKDYFETLPKWDGINHIENLSKYIVLKNEPEHRERFNRMFAKMFVRSVACNLEVHNNKQAFVLVHYTQNSGKTTFLRWLVPTKLKTYYAENISTDKDSLIALCENFIINLDELSTLSKQDINALKSVMSKGDIKERPPYGRKPVTMKRRCNFVGSTNKTEFLTDETGNVRWLCFEIDKIVWSQNKKEPNYKTDIDIDKVWSHAYHLFKSGFKYELTEHEVTENDIANHEFMVTTPEMELIMQYLEKSNEFDKEADFLTATDILDKLSNKVKGTIKLNANNIGKALAFYNFERTQKRINNIPMKGYYVKVKETASNLELIPIKKEHEKQQLEAAFDGYEIEKPTHWEID